MELTVARITRPHALRGEVALDLRTDSPETRLTPGSVFRTSPAAAGPLTLVRARRDGHAWFASFAEVGDRTAAEALRGVLLLVEAEASQEQDAWYSHELEGLAVALTDATPAGICAGIEHLPAQDALRIREPDGTLALLPLVKAFVTSVDIAGGTITIDPPGGLLAAKPPAGEA